MVRRIHRWMAPVFVVALIAVIITGPLRPETPAQIAQQLMMALLMLSGIVLFSYPFVARWQKRNATTKRRNPLAAPVRVVRRGHYWIAPLFVLSTIAVVVTGPPQPNTPAQIAQQIAMGVLAISGVVLFVTPLIRRIRKRTDTHTQPSSR